MKNRAKKILGPSLARRVRNAGAAGARAGAAALRGEPVRVPGQEAARRLGICRGCEEYYDPAGDVCRHTRCGCYLVNKVRLATERCPIGKW